MKLEHAIYGQDAGGYPFLGLFVDGQPARIYLEGQKFLYRDVVFLGDEWEERLDPIDLPADRKRGYGPITLEGCVKDRRLARMVEQMREADRVGKFHPGPIEIPAED